MCSINSKTVTTNTMTFGKNIIYRKKKRPITSKVKIF